MVHGQTQHLATAFYRHSYSPSIAIDSNDAIHVAYHYGTNIQAFALHLEHDWFMEMQTMDSSNAGWGAEINR